MPKKNKRDVRADRADLRRRTHAPSPEIKEILENLRSQLTPATFAKARQGHTHLNLRERTLNLPVMCALVLSMVSRQFNSLSELLRELKHEGMLWAEATSVSKQALSKRLTRLPASLFADLFREVLHQRSERTQPKGRLARAFEHLQESYACVWIADASTLEQLRKTTQELREIDRSVLGGKMLLLFDAISRRPVESFYTPEAQVSEQRFIDQILEALPRTGLLIFDAGFTNHAFFDTLSERGSYFVTRLRGRAHVKVLRTLASTPHYRDEIIQLGSRGYKAAHEYRLVSVLWGKTWHQYLSNELEANRLSAREIAELYRTRWRIEEAFALTKRLLGLSYLWVGGSNGVEIQIWSTLIFYTALMDVAHEVADRLEKPIERISIEMVFRSFYHVSRAQQRDPETKLIDFVTTHAKSLGIVKEQKKRNRQRDQQLLEIWGEP